MLLDKVRCTIEKNGLISNGDRIICAVSGGADSVCLLHTMIALRSEYDLKLYIANVNHLIRGKESDEDSNFVRAIAKASGIELFYREYDVVKIAAERKIGEEECGRVLRYEFFEEISKSLGGAKIATAHNLNDNAETVLFRLVRGTSAKGLCGIIPKRDNVIRPLLDVSRSEIEKYLKSNSLTWREDSTNSIPIYARNKIRLNVIPVLREISSSADEKIVSAAKFISEDSSFIDELALKKEKECFKNDEIILENFEKLHISIKRRIAAKVLSKWGAKEITSEKIESFLQYTMKDNGKEFDVNGRVYIKKSYGKIAVYNPTVNAGIYCVLDENTDVITQTWKLSMFYTRDKIKRDTNSIAIFDAGKITGPFVVTYRQNGDRMMLKGIGGTKKIADIFTDEKIDSEKRGVIPIVRKNEDILYLGGVRQTSKYNVDSDTKEYLVIKYEEREDGYEKN